MKLGNAGRLWDSTLSFVTYLLLDSAITDQNILQLLPSLQSVAGVVWDSSRVIMNSTV